MTANSELLHSLPTPELLFGDGTTCPGCGVPFYTQRNPQRPADRAVNTGIDFDSVQYTNEGPVLNTGLLVLCEPCIKHLAGHVDMIDAERGKVRASDVKRAERRDTKVRDAAESLTVLRGAISAADAAVAAIQDELGLEDS